MAGGIPIILCGRVPAHQQAVTEAISSEFNVIRVCASPEELQQAIKDYFVDATASPKPEVIVVGGGFTPEQYEQITTSSPKVQPGSSESEVAWYRPGYFASGGGPPQGGPPPTEVIAKMSREGLWKNLDAHKSGSSKGQAYYF